jgi:antitoxin MazE
MRTVVRKLGNSRGILIPKPMLAQVGLETGEAEIRVEGNTITLRPVAKQVRVGWAEASQKLAAEKQGALEWPEFANANDAELKW